MQNLKQEDYFCLERWLELTSDKFVHDIIQSYKLYFLSPVAQTCILSNIVQGHQMVHMDHEIKGYWIRM